MAITQTGAIYKAFSFDNVSSRNYGVYITGEAVYNAPERDVEMISIPGRNGAFALDNGRFENIEVKYPAGIAANSETDFAQAVSDLRNFLCSKKGYFRLTDEYNPNEYRMAVYKSGLEVLPVQAKAGEFEIIFECKPQRFLTSGETASTVANNGTLTNPTLFESRPMLEVTGYGDIGINGETITVQNVPLGEIKISEPKSDVSQVTLDVGNLNTGDAIYSTASNAPYARLSITKTSQSGSLEVYAPHSGVTNGRVEITENGRYSEYVKVYPFETGGISFAKGTAQTITTTVALTIISSGTQTNCTLTLTTTYNASTNKISMSLTRTDFPASGLAYKTYYAHPAYYGYSTKTVLPDVMYIDLDIGEAYGTLNNEPLSFNNLVTMPAKLPTLKTGTNTFTKSNTVTQLKVTPRWWKI